MYKRSIMHRNYLKYKGVWRFADTPYDKFGITHDSPCNIPRWFLSLCEQHIRIHDQLEDSLSLKNYLDVSIEKAYPAALRIAHQETGLAVSVFPVNCPYSINELLDEDFYPSES